MPDLPNPVYWSIPAFLGLLLVEYVVARRQRRRLFEGRDTATSLGLGYWKTQRAIVLPQALVAVIPAFVNNLLSTFMDTSLVAVVSMYDLTGSLRLALGDPRWRDFFIEGYLFVAAIYFGASFVMSRYSLWLERRLKIGNLH